MIVTTTSLIQGKEIIDYIDIVNGEAIMGANIVRDLFASVRDIVGGRSGAYESKLKEARDVAMEEMKQLAKQKGANAIVGVDIDYEVVRDGMLMVAVSGMAVRIKIKY
ncbi:heavy metal-binding domain-containing protein [Bacillus paramycoides]|uniref:heavy metal-binding domain-containing protein n=1 Tax=Bacillus paramycoides TaxID=2026194 RepID=UPI002E1EC2C7|nr:heavy metal-binding domain-containing protein [Bacillus paramycoides]